MGARRQEERCYLREFPPWWHPRHAQGEKACDGQQHVGDGGGMRVLDTSVPGPGHLSDPILVTNRGTWQEGDHATCTATPAATREEGPLILGTSASQALSECRQ